MASVLTEEKTWQDKETSARTALSYIAKIAEKLPTKLHTLKNPKEEFKILIQDPIYGYDSKGMDLTLRTFKRRDFNIRMTRYKRLQSGKYAYIFALSRTI